jgi:hypothetical protein
MEWKEKFDKEFNQSLHASCKNWVDADKEIKDFIEKILEEQKEHYEKELKIADDRWKSNEKYREKYIDDIALEKRRYDNLYLEVSLLRQAVGEYLTDHNDIYRKLNEIAPL